MFLGMTYYDIFMNFLIYSVIGWIVEVIYHAVTTGQVINRGFLNGPVCPIYGFGMLAVFFVMHALPFEAASVNETPAWAVFIAGTLLASLVELIGGWLLLHFFHARWWDYSSKPFNLHGFICLEFSLIWGLGIVMIIRIFHPFLDRNVVHLLPQRIGIILMSICYIGFLADFVVSVLCVAGLNKKLEELSKIRSSMRVLSDAMSESIAAGTIVTAQKVGEGRVQAALAKAELKDEFGEKFDNLSGKIDSLGERFDTLGEKFDTLGNRLDTLQNVREKASDSASAAKAKIAASLKKSSHFGTGRLLKAFPNMKHNRFAKELRELQDLLK